MRKQVILIVWVVWSLPMIVQAQWSQKAKADSCNYHFEGFVRDIVSKRPLPFATVQIQGTTQGTVADESGYFTFTDLCLNEFDVVVSNVGYKQAVHHHDPHHNMPNIYLAPDSITLKSVTIEGEAQPGDLRSGTVETLSTQELEQNQSASLGDLASNITGVSVLSTGQNVVKPVIHGLHSNRILIINNGVRHEFQSWGAEHAPEIDASLIDNISVVKGAATVRYGPEALGGVLLINPPKLELLTQWQGEIGVTGQSNGQSGESTIQLQKGYRQVALLGQASYVYQGDLRAPDYVLTNTGKRESSMALAGRYHWRKLDFTAFYSHFDQELGILRGSVTGNLNDLVAAIESEEPPLTKPFSYQINNPRQTVQHDLLKVEGRWNGHNQSVEVQYAYQVNQRQEYDVRRGTNNDLPSIDLILSTQSLDATWKHPDFSGWQGSVGVQGLYQDNNNQPGTNTVPFVPNYNNTRLGIYLIEGRAFGANRLEGGLRYDYQFSSIRGREPNNDIYRNELSYQNVTATLGLILEMKPGHLFRTNIGTAWRPPNISELYSFGKHQASIEYGLWRYMRQEDQGIVVDDILTEDEKPAPSEIGFKWIGTYEITTDKLQSDVTAYLNYIRNYIYTKPAGITQTVRGAFPYFIYDQDNAVLAGVDASVRWMHTARLNSTVKGSFLWAKEVTHGYNFVGLPPANLQYQFWQQLPKFAFVDESYWNISFSYTFRQFQTPRVIPVSMLLQAEENDENLFANDEATFDIMSPPSGYGLIHLGWSGQINHVQLGVQIKNLLNTEYRSYTDRLRYFADETDRNFIVSLKYLF